MGKTALKHDLDKYFRYASSNVAWINFNLVFNEWPWTGKLKKIAAATIDWNDNKKKTVWYSKMSKMYQNTQIRFQGIIKEKLFNQVEKSL